MSASLTHKVNLPPSRDILGVGVSPLDWGEAIDLVAAMVAQREPAMITFLNAHNSNMACRDREFASVINDFIVLPDGVGVDIASQLLYGERFPDNLNGTDFIPSLLKSISTPMKVGLLGASDENVNEACRRLSASYPGHEFHLVSHGFFSPVDEESVLGELKALRPDILLVAMGVPRQELWIARNITSEHATLAFAVGALIDFEAGAIPRAPQWMRSLRSEWVFRLSLEPARLWRRYILGNPEFLLRVIRQKFTGNTGFPGERYSI